MDEGIKGKEKSSEKVAPQKRVNETEISDMEESDEEDQNVEEIGDEILGYLGDLDDIRSRCNGKINRDMKVSIGLIREKTEEMTDLAAGKDKVIQKLRAEIKTLRKEIEKLGEKKVENKIENKSNCEKIQQEILAEVKTLREEVKVIRDIKIGKKRMAEGKGNEKGNMEAAGDTRIKDGRTYADMVGRNWTSKGGIGKQVEVKTTEGSKNLEEQGKKIEVLRIKSQGEFSRVIGKIRKGTDPGKNGVAVLTAKKDEKGNIVIRVQGRQEDRTRYREELGKCLEGKDKIEKVQQMEYLHISNLDVLTTVEEIEERIVVEADIAREEVKVTSLRPAFGESQKATIKVPRDAAEKLARRGKIGIGMMACGVRIRHFETRCYKCGGTGHLAIKCEDEANIGKCFRCGKVGHFARECEEEKWRDAKTGLETGKDRTGGKKNTSEDRKGRK